MGAARVFLALGANQGDRLGALRAAYRQLAAILESPRISALYETEPMYVVDQPPFLNAVCAGATQLEPPELLRETQRIEASLGRARRLPKGPRTIDIDILLFGERVLADPRLTVPHPGMRERAFVLVPLLEIAPDLCDPSNGTPYRHYLDTLGRAGVSYSRTLDAQH